MLHYKCCSTKFLISAADFVQFRIKVVHVNSVEQDKMEIHINFTLS